MRNLPIPILRSTELRMRRSRVRQAPVEDIHGAQDTGVQSHPSLKGSRISVCFSTDEIGQPSGLLSFFSARSTSFSRSDGRGVMRSIHLASLGFETMLNRGSGMFFEESMWISFPRE